MASDDSDATLRADALKAEGNQHFQRQQFSEAITAYTAALELKASQMLLSNRAAAYIRMELAGAALTDANEAIALDPSFLKAYYRRASAHIMIGKLKEAMLDLRHVVKRAPHDAEAKRKLEQCQSEVRQQNFLSAISHAESDPVSKTLNPETIFVPSHYTGPLLENFTVTSTFVSEMKSHFEKECLICRRDVVSILQQALGVLSALPNIVDITLESDEDITICGDTHGQYYDLLNIFKMNGAPSETNMYLFNGDFVDRGSYSFEVVTTLLCYKVLYPTRFFMSRGNHEGRQMNSIYGFEGEVRRKYDNTIVQLFAEVFNALPTGHLINKKVFVVHGGLYSQENVTIADILKPNRFRDIPDEGVLCESLWSDPQPQPGLGQSKRGIGCSFGPDVTKKFLQQNNLELLIRSHEVKDQGYAEEHDGKCITVFSAPNYCDQVGNKGAFLKLSGNNWHPRFTSYEAVPHPGKRAMYYSSLAGLM